MSSLKSARFETGGLSIGDGAFKAFPGLLPDSDDSRISKSGVWRSRTSCAEVVEASATYWKSWKVGASKVCSSRCCLVSGASRLSQAIEAKAWGNAEAAQNSGAKQKILIVLTIP